MGFKKKLVLPLVGDNQIKYTLQTKHVIKYIRILIQRNFVFMCLPYTDCTRIETYTNAPKPLEEWLV